MWLTPICKLTIDQITPLVKGLLGIAFAFAGRYYASLWGVVFHIPVLPKIHCNVGNSGSRSRKKARHLTKIPRIAVGHFYPNLGEVGKASTEQAREMSMRAFLAHIPTSSSPRMIYWRPNNAPAS
jgi:hypothetical protein